MKPTLVTGASGHVGNNVCRLLVERGERVRAMLRASADPAPLAGLDAGKYAYFSSVKAARELGYTFRSARDTVARTIHWLVERGFVPAERRQALHPTPVAP
jgi:nucleoside-diphosphate-sugar epimerase